MEFEAYLIDKKIDPEAFRSSEPEKWESFKSLFEIVHPNSFTVQKKFLLNDLRRLYHLKTPEPVKVKATESKEDTVSAEPKKPVAARPVIKKPPLIKKPDDNTPAA